MIKGIIFDLDGTLLDTSKDIATAVNKTMDKYNLNNFSNEEVIQKVGNGMMKLIDRCLPEYKKDLLPEAFEVFCNNYEKCYLDETTAYEGINEVLLELNKRNILIGVNTNKQNEFCEKLLSSRFPEVKFFKIIGNRKGVPGKPDPYSSLEIVSDMGFKNEEVLYVGDSDTDILTAKNTNLKSIGCLWGFRNRETLEKQEADYIISKPEEILNYI